MTTVSLLGLSRKLHERAQWECGNAPFLLGVASGLRAVALLRWLRRKVAPPPLVAALPSSPLGNIEEGQLVEQLLRCKRVLDPQ